MSLPTVVTLIDGIETRLKTISGLHVTEYVPDNVALPAAIVGVPPWNRETMRAGVFSFDVTVTVLTSRTLDRTGQRALAGYADFSGSNSIMAAFDADRTLGLSSYKVDCVVMSFQSFTTEDIAAINYFGGVFVLKTTATA